jgi:DNA helicase-2/ATP-dependent DNA helicase PcrA
MFYLHNYRTCRGLPGVPSVSQPAARMAVVPATPEGVLEALDPEQRAVAEAVRGPVCVLAGAGTGKTRAITHRIAYGALTGAMPPQQVLAVTFTTRAASEMRSRLRLLGVAGVQAHTFHAAALRQLKYFWPRLVGGGFPRLLETKLRVVATAAGRSRVPARGPVLRDLTSEIEWAKATLAGPDGYPVAAARARRDPPVAAEEVAKVYAAYEDVKQAEGLLDFEDLLLLTAAAIEDHRDIAAEVRARYRHFVVDEFQDVNPLQQRLLEGWLGDRTDICVVGDANQTIYSFTGASASYLLDFPRRYPDATTVRLVRDYRSTPQVVALANRLLGPASGLQLLAQQPDGPEPAYAEHADEPAEAAAVTAECQRLIASGVPAREIAVLFRVNAQSEVYEQAMAAAGVPYVLRGGERFFDRPEVRQAIVLLRGAARSPEDAAPAGLVHDVTHVLAAAGWTPEPPAGSGAARERWESVRALLGLAEELLAAEPTADLAAFVAELEARAAAQHAPQVEGVTLASMHAAKGLEWDAVFLVGLVDGTVPIQHAVSAEQVEEERRLLYVGITRARRHLRLSWALSRSPGGRGSRSPSRFLDGLRPASSSAAPARAPGRAKQRRGPARCRVCQRPLSSTVERKLGRCAGCPSTLDEALFDRLRAWRLERARAGSMPAFVVFTDATLTAIAEIRPATVEALAAISGIGPRKIEDYGDEVLALVADVPPP